MLYAKAIGALVVLLVIAGLVITVQHYRTGMIQAEALAATYKKERDQVLAANKTLDEALTREQQTNAANNRRIAALVDSLQAIGESVLKGEQEEKALRDANQGVDDFLSTPVPPDLWMQLNR